jgi:hypothetical protein
VPRMEPGKQRPIESMEEARIWEHQFIGEFRPVAIRVGRELDVRPRMSLRKQWRRSSMRTLSGAQNLLACAVFDRFKVAWPF